MSVYGRKWRLPAAVSVAVGLVMATVVGVNIADAKNRALTVGSFEKSNVVVLMTDDQTMDMLQAMPRTLRLVGERGVTFENYYVSYPLCCPSRATYLTGQYAHNNGVAHNGGVLGGYQRLDELDSLPVWMQAAGYVTSHIGKYPNGYGMRDNKRHVPLGWDEWRGAAGSPYRMWGYTLNENGDLNTYGEPFVEDPDLYQTDVFRDKAVDYIERRSGEDRPFFLSAAFVAPHAETPGIYRGDDSRSDRADKIRLPLPRVEPGPRPAPRHRGAFAEEALPRPMSFDERDVGDKPWYIQNYPRLDDETEAKIEQSYRRRLESLLAVDEAVEDIVSALRRSGELENTYLIFVSDNGFFFGEHRVPMGKFLPYEASSHVPLLIRGPGIPAGETSQELVTNTDLAATLVDIAGTEASVPLDGQSLLRSAEHPFRLTGRPILHEGGGGAVIGNLGEDSPWGGGKPEGGDLAGKAAAGGDLNQDLLKAARKFRVGANKGQVLTVAYEGIRTRRYLYIRYIRGAEELYDLQEDPYELRSVHADPAYADTRAYLRQRLDELQDCRGEECNTEIADAPPPETASVQVRAVVGR